MTVAKDQFDAAVSTLTKMGADLFATTHLTTKITGCDTAAATIQQAVADYAALVPLPPPPPPPPPTPTGAFSAIAALALAWTATCENVSLHLVAAAPSTSGMCKVEYRAKDQAQWKRGTPLPYDPRSKEYRGSLLCGSGSHYKEYLVRFEHDDGSKTVEMAVRTRLHPAYLPQGKVTALPASTNTVLKPVGGTPDAYAVYTGEAGKPKAVIDAGRARDYCAQLGAGVKHVIFKGLIFKSALKHCVLMGSTTSANSDDIAEIHYLDCEFTDWGSSSTGCKFADNLQSALFSASSKLMNVSAIGCWIHAPRMGSNSWDEYQCGSTSNKHPSGTQGITFKNGKGGYIFESTTFEGTTAIRFNDGAGETNNFSNAGFPYADTDFLRCLIRFCWDDGLEIEGRAENIRIIDCAFEEVNHAIGLAPVNIGPVYIVRCVGISSRTGTVNKNLGYFLKWRRTSGTTAGDWGGGHVFVVNVTLLGFKGLVNEEGADDALLNWHVSNLLDACPGTAKSIDAPDAANDTEVRCCMSKNGSVLGSRVRQSGNIVGTPTWAANKWDAATGKGSWQLASSSKGFQAGQAVPGIVEIAAPDLGAHQHGESPFGYGHLNAIAA
jgi:hypothetical protein